MSSLPAEGYRLTGISPKTYEHPADRAATAALASVPYLDLVVRKLIELGYERVLRQSYLGSSVRLSEEQLPDVWRQHNIAYATPNLGGFSGELQLGLKETDAAGSKNSVALRARRMSVWMRCCAKSGLAAMKSRNCARLTIAQVVGSTVTTDAERGSPSSDISPTYSPAPWKLITTSRPAALLA